MICIGFGIEYEAALAERRLVATEIFDALFQFKELFTRHLFGEFHGVDVCVVLLVEPFLDSVAACRLLSFGDGLFY